MINKQQILATILFFLINSFSYANTTESLLLLDAENAFNKIQLSLLSFSQIDSNGNNIKGLLLIDRRKKLLRIEYSEPTPLQIIVRDKKIYMYDFDLEQYTYAKHEQNLFEIFFTKNLKKLDNKLKIKKSTKTLKLELFAKNLQQYITMNFSQDTTPSLLSLKIKEDSGTTIEIQINHIKYLSNIPDEFFIMNNPKIFGSPSKMDISKLK